MAYSNYRIQQLENNAQTVYWFRMVRYVFYLYGFLAFVFWFLNCLEMDLYRFNFLFIGPYKILHNFYRVEGVAVDFSLAIIGTIALIIGGLIDFICNVIYNGLLDQIDREEERLEKKKIRKKRVQPVNPNVYVQQGVNSQVQPINENPFEESKLLFIIQPHVNRIKKKETDIELTFQEVELWRQRVNKKLIENVSYSKPIQKGYYRKNLFLMYRDFNYVDDFLYYIKPTVDSIVIEFKKYGVLVSYNYVFSSITKLENLEKELDMMDTILSLNFQNEFIVTNRFKVTYDNKPIQKYTMKFKGEYNLSKNLSIVNRQPLYSLKEVKKQGDIQQ
ncbi:hypothetical protein IJ182_02670 [bacterium]|nr:hypothetical protein [bacterium]